MTKLILEDKNFFKNKVKELVKEALKLTYEDIDLDKVTLVIKEHLNYIVY